MILDDIVSYKRAELQSEKERKPLKELLDDIENVHIRDFKGALNGSRISIIAEIKKASPSKGIIRNDFNPVCIARVYNDIDVDAISVLTETKFFQGKNEYIKRVKEVTSKPVLRKDFIVDEYQIYQTKAIGGDAILLIAAVLGSSLKDFYKRAKEIDLHPLVEVHSLEELYTALEIGCDIIGINNRDLKTFNVDLKTTERLLKYMPNGIIKVSESGIKSPEDIKYLRSIGINAVLIGETFMVKMDNSDEVRDFVKKSKEAC